MRMHKDEDTDTLKYTAAVVTYLPERKSTDTVNQLAVIGKIGFETFATEAQMENGMTAKMAVDELVGNYEMFKKIKAIVVVGYYNSYSLRVVVHLHLDLSKLPLNMGENQTRQQFSVSRLMEIPEIKRIINTLNSYGFTPHHIVAEPINEHLFERFRGFNIPIDEINASITMH